MGYSIEILRDIYNYILYIVCMSVCPRLSMGNRQIIVCMGGIMWSKHAHAQSQFWEFETKYRLESLILPSSGRLKLTCDTRIIYFYYALEQL